MRRMALILAGLAFAAATLPLLPKEVKSDPRLKGAFRKPAQNGWTFVHLEGTPSEIGFQHGYLLAPEILDAERVTALEQAHNSKKDWKFFRNAARDMMWPHIEAEYRAELEGIAAGLKAKGVPLDVWDVVALNASLEWGYYVKEYDREHQLSSAAQIGRAHV